MTKRIIGLNNKNNKKCTRAKFPVQVIIQYIMDEIIDKEVNKKILHSISSYSGLKEKLPIGICSAAILKSVKRRKSCIIYVSSLTLVSGKKTLSS